MTRSLPPQPALSPRDLTASESRIATSGNVFTFALLKQVNRNQRNANVFISPISASTALSVAMNGASRYHSDFLREAKEHVLRARFSPASLGGCKVRVLVQQPYEFLIGR